MPRFIPKDLPRNQGKGQSDAEFTARITKGFQSGQMTPTQIFAAIGARGAPTGRKVPPRRPPVGGGGTGIPGPVGVAPGPGMLAPDVSTRRRKRRRVVRRATRARMEASSRMRGREQGRSSLF